MGCGSTTILENYLIMKLLINSIRRYLFLGQYLLQFIFDERAISAAEVILSYLKIALGAEWTYREFDYMDIYELERK